MMMMLMMVAINLRLARDAELRMIGLPVCVCVRVPALV